MRQIITTLAAIVLGALISAPAHAQTYPDRTVAIIVPFPPGGSVDGVARIVVDKLNHTVGPHFIVENRAGGASGNVGANVVAKAAPDGYTLLLTASLHVVNPFLYKNMPFDVVKDFTPVTLIAAGPLIVSTTPSVPARTLREFFDLVRQNPEKYTFGTTSIGSAGHLVIERLKREAGVNTLVVAYKGTAPALTDLMSGQIQLLADPMLSSLPLARAGRKGAGDHQHQAAGRGARDSDRRGVRPTRLRLFFVVRPVGTERPAGRYRRQAAGEHRRGFENARRANPAWGARLRTDWLDARPVHRLHSKRNGEIRKNHPRR